MSTCLTVTYQVCFSKPSQAKLISCFGLYSLHWTKRWVTSNTSLDIQTATVLDPLTFTGNCRTNLILYFPRAVDIQGGNGNIKSTGQGRYSKNCNQFQMVPAHCYGFKNLRTQAVRAAFTGKHSKLSWEYFLVSLIKTRSSSTSNGRWCGPFSLWANKSRGIL